MLSSGMEQGRSALGTGSPTNLLADYTKRRRVATFFRYPRSAWLVCADRRECEAAEWGGNSVGDAADERSGKPGVGET